MKGTTSLQQLGGPNKERVRLVVMGLTGVGKTAIIRQYLYHQYANDYKETVEEMHTEHYAMQPGFTLTLEILDTSGSREFPAMRRLAITQGDGFVLVYAINSKDSFEEVCQLRNTILELKKDGVPIVVVGNKSDLHRERVVAKEIAETVSSIDWETGFVECSAKDNTNVAAIFAELMLQSNVDLNQQRKGDESKRRPSLPSFMFSNHELKDKMALKRHSCVIS